jgi:hypothetical protein
MLSAVDVVADSASLVNYWPEVNNFFGMNAPGRNRSFDKYSMINIGIVHIDRSMEK